MVAPRAFGTLEFRAADAQCDPEKLAELCAFYVLLVRAATIGVLRAREEAAKLFWKACESGVQNIELLLADLRAMKAACSDLPNPINAAFDRLVARAQRMAPLQERALDCTTLG